MAFTLHYWEIQFFFACCCFLEVQYTWLFNTLYMLGFVEVCVAKTPRTPDLEVWGSSLARRVVSLDKEFYATLSLFTQVYIWVPATYCLGVTL